MKIKKIYFLLILLFLIWVGCKRNSVTAGGIAFDVVIPVKKDFRASENVDVTPDLASIKKAKLVVTIEGNNFSTYKEFPFTKYSAVVTGIPSGKGYKISLSSKIGLFLYGKTIENVIVLPGTISDLGTVYLEEIKATANPNKEPPAAPVIYYYPEVTRSYSAELYGWKETGTAILINGNIVVPASSDTSWKSKVNLNPNRLNKFEVVARKFFEDGSNLDSDPVVVPIVQDMKPPAKTEVNFSFAGDHTSVLVITPGEDTPYFQNTPCAGTKGSAVFRGNGNHSCPSIKQGKIYRSGDSINDFQFVGYYSHFLTDASLAPGTTYTYCFFTVDKAYNYSDAFALPITTATRVYKSLEGKIKINKDYIFALNGGSLYMDDYSGNEKLSKDGVKYFDVAYGAYVTVGVDNTISLFKDADDSNMYSFTPPQEVYGVALTGNSTYLLSYVTPISAAITNASSDYLVAVTTSLNGNKYAPYLVESKLFFVHNGYIYFWSPEINPVKINLGYTPVTDPVAVKNGNGYYLGFKYENKIGIAVLTSSLHVNSIRLFDGKDFALTLQLFLFVSPHNDLVVLPLKVADIPPLIFGNGDYIDVSKKFDKILWRGNGYFSYR